MSANEQHEAEILPAANRGSANRLYEIEWHYSPSDFLTDSRGEPVLGAKLTIENGTGIALIEPEVYENTPLLPQQLHCLLDARCKVQQFKTGKHYEIGRDSTTEHHWDGRRTKHLVSFSATLTLTAGTPDRKNNRHQRADYF